MTTHFTSDTHFYHETVIGYSDRPWRNAAEMNEGLIERWNNAVAPGDTVYHLGDIALASVDQIAAVIAQLNGQIHAIWGNHDKNARKLAGLFASAQDYKEVKVGKQKIILFHYGLRVWRGIQHGTWQLYGHSHGHLYDDPHLLSMDVGVDPNNYRPLSFQEVAAHMTTKKFIPVDHHA